jgi:hypothetical protein
MLPYSHTSRIRPNQSVLSPSAVGLARNQQILILRTIDLIRIKHNTHYTTTALLSMFILYFIKYNYKI